MPSIAFMHIGAQIELPTLMVRSFRKHNPQFRIVQVADLVSPEVEGVDEVVRREMSDPNVMLFRMRCFAALPTSDPTWFLDTDMLCVQPLAHDDDVHADIAVCRREFGINTLFNHRFGGMEMSEYEGRTLGSVYPYVGCATRLSNSSFWADCLADMEALDPKFFNWYGDQEAIRQVVESGRHAVSWLPESRYACLPEHEAQVAKPRIFHFKGQRKPLMLARAAAEGLT